jgi:hypothetical protein
MSVKNFAVTGVAGFVAPRHLKAIHDTGHRVVAAVDPHDAVGLLDRFGFDVRFFTEFERFDEDSRAALMAAWARGWDLVDTALAPLTDEDLGRTITIRGEPHTVSQALIRQLAHYGYHVGQIVLLARIARGAAWSTLSVPRGHSAQFNAAMHDSFRTESKPDPS